MTPEPNPLDETLNKDSSPTSGLRMESEGGTGGPARLVFGTTAKTFF